MTHDPLCPWRKANKTDTFETYFGGGFAVCHCDLIAKVREDERRKADGQSVILSSDCEKQIAEAGRDMLAKCITAVDARIRPTLHPVENAGIGEALAALRALKDKP